MRKPIIAGNWKMNKTPEEAKELVSALIPLVKDADCDVVVCVPAADYTVVAETIKGTNIKLGAQNVHFAKSGAYTGELSADMLKACGVEYVVIGNSERRQYFGETDKTVNLRTRAAEALPDIAPVPGHSPLELFEALYAHQNNQPLTPAQRDYLSVMISEIWEDEA